MRFATRVFVLQIGAVVAVVAVCTAIFLAVGVQQLQRQGEQEALGIARVAAEDPEVRRLIAQYSADPGTPDAAELRNGYLQHLSKGIAARTGVYFVVFTDDHGIRLAHPDADRLGEEVSTPWQRVLAGHEVVDWEPGTLGESLRAKVPVYAVGAPETGRAIGEVSVGFTPASVFDDLPPLLVGVAAAAVAAVGIGVLTTLRLRRRWERLTLGVQPEELVALVQNQSAVLDGIDDGVLAVGPDGRVTAVNHAARSMLERPRDGADAGAGAGAELVGRRADDVPELAGILAAARDGAARGGYVHRDRVLYLDAREVERDRHPLGTVVVLRDRTALLALTERLETVRATTSAMRVQRHEFANRLHVATGLLDAGRTADARDFLAEQAVRGPVAPASSLDAVTDPFLRSFVALKSLEAQERRVRLAVAPTTELHGVLGDVEDAGAILGNLVDNAIGAAARGPEPRFVEVELLGAGGELAVTVTGSGAGIPADAELFVRRPGLDDGEADRIHGLGVGLPLSRELARRRGGDVWVIDRGGPDGGAVVAARLPGVMVPVDGAGADEGTGERG